MEAGFVGLQCYSLLLNTKHFGLSVNAIGLTQVGCTHPLLYRIALILLAQNNFEMLIMQVRVYRFTLILHRFITILVPPNIFSALGTAAYA